jgi:hypothetical protein
MPRIVIIGLVFLVSCCDVQPADAQDDRLYAGVSGMWSTQGSMPLGGDPDMPTTGVSGTAFGMAGEFGAFLKPRVDQWTFSLSFEFSIPVRFDSVQETDYFTIYRTDNQHRDLVFSGVFHFHAPPIGPIRVGLVAGPSIVQEDTLQRTAYRIGPGPPILYTGNFGPFGPETQLTRWTVGLTVGADVGIRLSRRVQIVPQLRLHWVNRADFGGDVASAFLGLGSWLIRPAVGIRLGF